MLLVKVGSRARACSGFRGSASPTERHMAPSGAVRQARGRRLRLIGYMISAPRLVRLALPDRARAHGPRFKLGLLGSRPLLAGAS